MSEATTDRPPTMAELKIQAVLDALTRNNGCKVWAARQLGVSLKTVYNLLRAGVTAGLVSGDLVRRTRRSTRGLTARVSPTPTTRTEDDDGTN